MENLTSKGIYLVKAGNHPDANISTAAIMRRGKYKCWQCMDTGNTLEINKPATYISVNSITQSCPTVCDPMDCSTPGIPYIYLTAISKSHGKYNPEIYNKYTHKKRKGDPNITLKMAIKSQENKRGREEKKQPTKIIPKQ